MTDPTWLTLLVGLGGAVVGAGGSVGAQAISAHYTAKQDAERLVLDKARFEVEDQKHSRQLLFESKRLSFVTALKLANVRLKSMTEESNSLDLINNQTRHLGSPEESKWWDVWREVRAEVRLLDETIDAPMQILQNCFVEWNQLIGMDFLTDSMQYMIRIEAAMDELRVFMQVSLGVREADTL